MLRAPHSRGEVPDAREPGAQATSVESLLALGLCAVVLLASMALLRTNGDYARTLEALASQSVRTPVPRARAGALAGMEPRPELVLLLSIDGLRADRLRPPPDGRPVTPHLDALAAQGAFFRTAGAQASHPLVSLKSLLTGKYPASLMLEETGADLFEQSGERDPRGFLRSTFRGVAGQLAAGLGAQGYRTVAVCAGEELGAEDGLAAGFDLAETPGGGWEDVLDRALTWLDEHPGTPAFLFLRAEDLSCPYPVEPRFEGLFCTDHEDHAHLAELCGPGGSDALSSPQTRRALRDHYDECARSVDERIGEFLEALETRDLLEHALVAVTSSHGERLGEDGAFGHGGLAPEELRVPLVLRFPDAWHVQPATIDEPVELVDLLPTFFLLCGAAVPQGLDGRSLLPVVLRGVRGRPCLVGQTTLDESPSLRSSAAMRTLFLPGRWQVLQDNERGEARFATLLGPAEQRAARTIEDEEFAPLLDLLLGREPPPSGAPEAEPEGPFSEGVAQGLEALGFHPAAASGSGPGPGLR